MVTMSKEVVSNEKLVQFLAVDQTPNQPDTSKTGDIWDKLPEYGKSFLKKHGRKLNEIL